VDVAQELTTMPSSPSPPLQLSHFPANEAAVVDTEQEVRTWGSHPDRSDFMWTHIDWPVATSDAENLENLQSLDGYVRRVSQALFPHFATRALFVVVTQPSTHKIKGLERKRAASWMRGSPPWGRELQIQMNCALKETTTANVLLIDSTVCASL
jgi:hypothetical protein